MPVKLISTFINRLLVAVLLLLPAACNPPLPASNRYQVPVESAQSHSGPVSELQSQALAALDAQDFQLAINFMQRAIKIEPRNAWNWHYLAQSYWGDGQYERCRSMIERSEGYASYDESLQSANAKLKFRCQE